MSQNQALTASHARPLGVRVRPDLDFIRQTFQGRDYWVVKDPITLKFYRFEEKEFALLKMLNGVATADELRREFHRRFAPQKISNQEIFQFVGMLYRSSLVISDMAGQAQSLTRRHQENRSKQRRATLTNILAIRLKGIDPDRFLNSLSQWFGWIFSTPVVMACVLFILSALVLIGTQFEYFCNKLPSFHQFFASDNWIYLAITLALTKVLHELGHGLACKRFGSQCHSMGIMFLVLMPCLYCDVSDSWTLPSKWRRAAIAVAGIYVELILAAFCTFIWWYSQPGLLNMLALNVVFVCSVSTLLFNANPLLRYDGYYILSDLIEVPNLRQKATSVLRRFFSRVLLGLPSPQDLFMPQRNRWLFATYAVAAAVYRWVITFSIFWFLYELLEPYGLKIIGQAIAMMAVYGLIGIPLVQLVRFFAVPGRLRAVKPMRFYVSMGVLALIILGVLFVPLPHHITATFHVQPQDSANVYVEVPGRVNDILVQENSTVQPGDEILQLASLDLAQEIARLHGETGKAWSRYKSTLAQAGIDPTMQNEVDASLAVFQASSQQLTQRQKDIEKLTVRAPIAGKVISASYVAPPDPDSGRLANWHGHPLETRNQRAFLDQGTVVCQIVPDEKSLEAILAIDQSDIEFISPGDQVEIFVRQDRTRPIVASVDSIAPQKMKSVPASLSSLHGGPLMTVADSDGVEKPMNATYQVRVPIDSLSAESSSVTIGAIGKAKIRTGNQTIGQRIWRVVCKTFRFDL